MKTFELLVSIFGFGVFIGACLQHLREKRSTCDRCARDGYELAQLEWQPPAAPVVERFTLRNGGLVHACQSDVTGDHLQDVIKAAEQRIVRKRFLHVVNRWQPIGMIELYEADSPDGPWSICPMKLPARQPDCTR